MICRAPLALLYTCPLFLCITPFGKPFLLPLCSVVELCCTALSSSRQRCSRPLGKKDACCPEQQTALLNPALWSYRWKSGLKGVRLFLRGPTLVFGVGRCCWAGRGWRCWDKARWVVEEVSELSLFISRLHCPPFNLSLFVHFCHLYSLLIVETRKSTFCNESVTYRDLRLWVCFKRN